MSLVGTATLAWCADRWGVTADPRRLRVNVVVSTDEPFVEETWVGQEIACGDARLRVVERVPRCRTVDVHQDGARAQGRQPETGAEIDGAVQAAVEEAGYALG